MHFSAITKIASLGGAFLLCAACSSNPNLPPSSSNYSIISAESLNQQQDSSRVVIDARSPDAFNGWTLCNEDRGGHIEGAKLFSARWITQKLNDLDNAYRRLEITPKSEVVIYGYDNDQAKTVADWLVNVKGHPSAHIQLLEKGYLAWASNPQRQVKSLPGYHTLIPALQLQEHMQQNSSLKVMEIGWEGEKGDIYGKHHVPGALYWDAQAFEHPNMYELKTAQAIRASLLKLGISSNTPVVVYSTESFGAARGATALKYAGVKNVSILNGGKDAWRAAGLPMETGEVESKPLTSFGLSGPNKQQVIIDIDQAKQLRQQKNGALVSIRTWDEFTGETSGYEYFDKKGRIPGALWARGESYTPWDLIDYHNPDGTMRNAQEILTLWHKWGIYPDTMELSFFCLNGWGAAEVWWYAQAMGYKNNTLFNSGFMSWAIDPDNPVAQGDISREESILEWKKVSGNLPVSS